MIWIRLICFCNLFFMILLIITPAQNSDGRNSTGKTQCSNSESFALKLEHLPKSAIEEKVTPRYPKYALKNRIEGRVSLTVIFDRNGFVQAACAVAGNPIFFATAEKAARKWKFAPNLGIAFAKGTKHRTKKLNSMTFIEFVFKLPS